MHVSWNSPRWIVLVPASWIWITDKMWQIVQTSRKRRFENGWNGNFLPPLYPPMTVWNIDAERCLYGARIGPSCLCIGWKSANLLAVPRNKSYIRPFITEDCSHVYSTSFFSTSETRTAPKKRRVIRRPLSLASSWSRDFDKPHFEKRSLSHFALLHI